MSKIGLFSTGLVVTFLKPTALLKAEAAAAFFLAFS